MCSSSEQWPTDGSGKQNNTDRFLSFIAPSLASFRACSSAFTRSIVARRRFSSFGSSQRRSALSRTSYSTHTNSHSNSYSNLCTALRPAWETASRAVTFRSGTDLLLLLILLLLLFLLGRPLQKAWRSIASNWIGMKFGRIVPEIHTHQLTDMKS